MKIGNFVTNKHTHKTLKIIGIDELPPEAVGKSDLGLSVYILSDGARWNETQLRECFSLEPVKEIASGKS